MPSALETDNKGSLMTSATVAAMLVALILIIAKFIAWWMSGSVVVLSSLIDSCLDALASFVNMMAVRHALVPADREHRFGHGKAEALAGLVQAIIITGSACYIFYEAILHLIEPQPLPAGGVGIVVMLGSIVLTLVLVLYQRYVIKRTGSVAVAADSLHYLSDLLSNASVILALILATWFGLTWADPVFAIGIGIFILASSRKIFWTSLDIVLDRELPDADRERIKAIARAHKEVINLHDLKTRSAGTETFIQFHVELDPAMNISTAHDITDEVEEEIRAAFPDADIIIHVDPYGIEEPRQVFE